MPDGSAVIFYSNRGGSYSIWSIRPDASGLTRLVEDPKDGFLYPAVSPPDGRISALNDAGIVAYLLEPPFPATSNRIKRLENNEVDGGRITPSMFSPDGKWLSGAWTSLSADPAGVAVYDLAGKRARKLTTDRGVWVAPFLPDNRRLIYFTTSAATELVVVDVADGRRRVIPVTLPLPAARESLALAPDGRTIYYGARRAESNVWKVERQ
jgi:Tol biopolymer transport system component